MPCNADTIIKIKVIKRSVKEKLLVVCAIGIYPVGIEDCEIELVLFVPVKAEERDLATQAIFEKDEYFSVGGKIVPDYYNNNIRPRAWFTHAVFCEMTVSTSTHLRILSKVPASNKCLLKVSFVEIVKEVPQFKNEKNAVIKVLVTDYSRRNYSFVVTVVFQYSDSHFKGLASLIRPRESVVFVISQMEIIENVLYVSGQDVNWREYNINNEQVSLATTNSARSKLLSVHKNIFKETDSEEIFKRIKVEETDEIDMYAFANENNNSSNINSSNDDRLKNEVDIEVNQENEKSSSSKVDTNDSE
ncbi:5046_t:CDS:2 [Cetraspora pellucida]|uniref:5046_t:CDS:1 n=1 Tax=Cetraspora pellucida TaxID=1433469 RepID=A0ACA9KD76_9GLOM|nr:5046_t:CDS:2 [Cetraspora pellucida]